MIGLDKCYTTAVFCQSKSQIHAVKNLNLEVNDGELLGILGHNGAGKTTLFGMLTGLIEPTSGTAIISNYDISKDMDKVRQTIGVCPQFDILWDELTAEDHLYMFAKLKCTHSLIFL